MTKPLDPEIKALYAIRRALEPLDEEARERALAFFYAATVGTTQERIRRGLRLVEQEERVSAHWPVRSA